MKASEGLFTGKDFRKGLRLIPSARFSKLEPLEVRSLMYRSAKEWCVKIQVTNIIFKRTFHNTSQCIIPHCWIRVMCLLKELFQLRVESACTSYILTYFNCGP